MPFRRTAFFKAHRCVNEEDSANAKTKVCPWNEQLSNSGQKMEVPPTDSKYKIVMHIVRSSYLDPNYKTTWVVHSVQTVKNLNLLQQYRAKAAELKYKRCDVTEYDMFTCSESAESVQNILERGLHSGLSSSNVLGNSQIGVHLSRHADIQLKTAEQRQKHECFLILHKVMLGRTLHVYPSEDNKYLLPAKDFDSHISTLQPEIIMPVEVQAIISQVFCFEYINGHLSYPPRHVLPYIIIHYKRPLMLTKPVVNGEHQRSMSQKTGPIQATNVSHFNQQQCRNGSMTNGHYFQPTLQPGVNPVTRHSLETTPSTDGNMHHAIMPARQIVAASTGLSLTTETSDMNNYSYVPNPFHQITSAIRLPYTPAVHTFVDQPSAMFNKLSSYAPFVNGLAGSTSLQKQSQQNSSWFSEFPRVSSLRTRHNSHHHHLSSREATDTYFEVDNHDSGEFRGMQLPVTIQVEGPNSEQLPLESDQDIRELQSVSVQLPTQITLSNCSDLTKGNIPQNQTDLCMLEKEVTTQAVVRCQHHLYNSESHDSVIHSSDRTPTELGYPIDKYSCLRPSVNKQGTLIASKTRNNWLNGERISSVRNLAQTPCDITAEDNLDKVFAQAKEHVFDIVKDVLPVYEIIKQKTSLCDDSQTEHSRSDQHTVTEKTNLTSQPTRHTDGNDEEENSPHLPSLQHMMEGVQRSNKKRKAQSTSSTLGQKRRAKNFQSNRSKKKKFFGRDALSKNPSHVDNHSMVPYSGLQEVVLCKMCRTGSIKVFCESIDVSAQKNSQQNSGIPPHVPTMCLLLESELSEADTSSVLKEINTDAADSE